MGLERPAVARTPHVVELRHDEQSGEAGAGREVRPLYNITIASLRLRRVNVAEIKMSELTGSVDRDVQLNVPHPALGLVRPKRRDQMHLARGREI
jgi:hypothetical protein